MLNICRTALSSVRNSALTQQIRCFRARKPVGSARAKSKRFYVREKKEMEPTTKAFYDEVWQNYEFKMQSVYQLFKTEAKFEGKESEVGKIHAKAELEAEEKLLKLNEEMNAKIRELQIADAKVREQEEKARRELEMEKLKQKEAKLVQMANERVKKLKEEIDTFIDPNNLEQEIEKMLNTRVDYNFAIDGQGKVYRSATSENTIQK